jgi:CBS domain-containing protein
MGRSRLHTPSEMDSETASTTVKINDLMAKRVITAEPHHTVARVRGLMQRNRILAVPVVGPEGEAVGVVTATDMLGDLNDQSPINHVMTKRVYKVPAYNDVSVAARVMRKHRIHHVIVTHEQRVVGIISSFDLLRLVEDRHFEVKNPSRPRHRKGSEIAPD